MATAIKHNTYRVKQETLERLPDTFAANPNDDHFDVLDPDDVATFTPLLEAVRDPGANGSLIGHVKNLQDFVRAVAPKYNMREPALARALFNVSSVGSSDTTFDTIARVIKAQSSGQLRKQDILTARAICDAGRDFVAINRRYPVPPKDGLILHGYLANGVIEWQDAAAFVAPQTLAEFFVQNGVTLPLRRNSILLSQQEIGDICWEYQKKHSNRLSAEDRELFIPGINLDLAQEQEFSGHSLNLMIQRGHERGLWSHNTLNKFQNAIKIPSNKMVLPEYKLGCILWDYYQDNSQRLTIKDTDLFILNIDIDLIDPDETFSGYSLGLMVQRGHKRGSWPHQNLSQFQDAIGIPPDRIILSRHILVDICWNYYQDNSQRLTMEDTNLFSPDASTDIDAVSGYDLNLMIQRGRRKKLWSYQSLASFQDAVGIPNDAMILSQHILEEICWWYAQNNSQRLTKSNTEFFIPDIDVDFDPYQKFNGYSLESMVRKGNSREWWIYESLEQFQDAVGIPSDEIILQDYELEEICWDYYRNKHTRLTRSCTEPFVSSLDSCREFNGTSLNLLIIKGHKKGYWAQGSLAQFQNAIGIPSGKIVLSQCVLEDICWDYYQNNIQRLTAENTDLFVPNTDLGFDPRQNPAFDGPSLNFAVEEGHKEGLWDYETLEQLQDAIKIPTQRIITLEDIIISFWAEKKILPGGRTPSISNETPFTQGVMGLLGLSAADVNRDLNRLDYRFQTAATSLSELLDLALVPRGYAPIDYDALEAASPKLAEFVRDLPQTHKEHSQFINYRDYFKPGMKEAPYSFLFPNDLPKTHPAYVAPTSSLAVAEPEEILNSYEDHQGNANTLPYEELLVA